MNEGMYEYVVCDVDEGDDDIIVEGITVEDVGEGRLFLFVVMVSGL